MEKTIEAIKEFFFDIIGFIIPGIIFIIVGVFLFDLRIEQLQKINVYIIIIIAYVFGYIIFSISLIKDDLFDIISKKININSREKIIDYLSKGKTFEEASSIIRKNKEVDFSDKLDYRPLRNIVISSIPDSEKKIYTFMFRAELFNQLHTISIISIIVILLGLIFSGFNFDFIRSGHNIIFVIILLVCVLTLRQGWKRFYSIAMSIPFSIYIEKFKK